MKSIRIEGDVAFVSLTQGYEAIIDAADVPLIAPFKWYAVVARRKDGTVRTVYAARSRATHGKEAQKTINMHRVIADTPDGMETDHKDGNGLNNRRENLRNATREQNHHNTRTPAHNSSGFKGVRWNPRDNRWVARICINRKDVHLGYHVRLEDALAAYAKASKEFHGEFGRLG